MSRRKVAASAAPAPRPELRRKVREALDALPDGRRATLPMLVEMVNSLLPLPATEAQVKEALTWNHDRGFVGKFENAELERDEWLITQMGRASLRQ